MKVLVVAAHPDDEAVGAGCALSLHAKAGDSVTVMFLTDGVSARPGWTDGERSARRHAAEKAASIMGFSDLRFYDFPDNALDSVKLIDITRAVEKVAADVGPDIVYTHHGGDLNVDHKTALRATLTCFRPQPSSSVQRILAFEVASSTGWDFDAPVFQPNHFVSAEAALTQKLDALEAYSAEMRPFPHARSRGSLEARARAWGAQVGLAAAEPFVLIREIVR